VRQAIRRACALIILADAQVVSANHLLDRSSAKTSMSSLLRRGSTVLGAVVIASLLMGRSAPVASAAVSSTAAWQQAIAKLALPSKGCFTAAYPTLQWQTAQCTTGPTIPFAPPPPAGSARPQVVGGSNDYAAVVTGLLSSATGSFDSESPGVTETGPTLTSTGPGPVTANAYTLQLNTQIFPTPSCSSSTACAGWEQFVYDSSHNQVLIQYWLLNYDADCPNGWTASGSSCYMDSSQRGPLSVPGPTAADLGSVTLTGEDAAAGGMDAVVMTVGGHAVANAAAPDSTLDLANSWNTAEFGVFGDGWDSEAIFSADTDLKVRVTTNNGTDVAPQCVQEGFTGETNNLNLVAAPTIGASSGPAIVSEQTTNPGAPSCAVATAQAVTGFGVTATASSGLSTPSAIAVDSSTGTVYVANSGSGSVSVIGNPDVPPFVVKVHPTDAAIGANPDAIAVDPATQTVYVANAPSPECVDPSCENTVSVIAMNGPGPDPTGGTTIASIPVGVNPDAVAVDPTTDTVYVANQATNSVSVINGSTDTVTNTIQGLASPVAIAVDPSTHNVYVAGAGSVWVINGSNVINTINDLQNPVAVAVDPTTATAYVANQANGTVSVIDGTNPVGGIDVGSGPLAGVAVDPSTQNVYVTGTSGLLDVFNESGALTSTPIDSIPDSGESPSAVAFDPYSRNAYVTNPTDNSVSVISPEASPTITGTPEASATSDGTSSATVVAGTGYWYQFTITGSPTPTVASSSPLPPGLTLTSDGLLSGIPSAPGTYQFTVAATNGFGPPAYEPVTMTVLPDPPTISNWTPSVAYTGTPYFGTVVVSGIPTPVTTVKEDPGPIPGLTLSDGWLTGTPTTPGSYRLLVTADNRAGGGGLDSEDRYLTVKQGPPPPPPPRVPNPPPPHCHPVLCM
jgi:YVTN family beta-propeller protein